MHNQKKTLPSQIKTNPLYHLEFDVKGVNNETRNLASLYDRVFIAKKLVEEKGINLSMTHVLSPNHVICQDESYKHIDGCNLSL